MSNKADFMEDWTRERGFRESMIGTKMIRSAARYVSDHDETCNLKMVADVYPYVGQLYGTTGPGAERSMRQAIIRSDAGGTVKDLIFELAQELRRMTRHGGVA